MVRGWSCWVLIALGCGSASPSAPPPAPPLPAPPPPAAPLPATPPPSAAASGATGAAPEPRDSTREEWHPSAPCRGTLSAKVVEVLSARAARTKGCYERALREDPKLSGSVLVSLRILPSGQVQSANLLKDEIGGHVFSACVRQHFLVELPVTLEGGCIDVNIPLRYTPTEPPPETPSESTPAAPT